MELDLDAIEAAEKAMTAAPWRVCGGFTPSYSGIKSPSGLIVNSMADFTTGVNAPDYDTQRVNITGIALLRNAAPALTRRIREQDAEIARLRDAIDDAANGIRDHISGIRGPHRLLGDIEARLRAASKGEASE